MQGTLNLINSSSIIQKGVCLSMLTHNLYINELLLFHFQEDFKPLDKPVKDNDEKRPITNTPHKKKGNKIHLDEAEGNFLFLSLVLF